MPAAIVTPRRGAPIINPNTGQPVTAAQAFAQWLQANEPALFNALAVEAAGKAPGLGDWSSILDSIGSGIETAASDVGGGLSNAASSVGNFLTSQGGMQSLANLAQTYLQGQTAQQVTQLQLSRANQGLAPAPVSYATNSAGQVVPVYTGASPPAGALPLNLGNGQTGYQLNNSQLAALSSGGVGAFLSKYGTVIALGGGLVLLGALVLKRE